MTEVRLLHLAGFSHPFTSLHSVVGWWSGGDGNGGYVNMPGSLSFIRLWGYLGYSGLTLHRMAALLGEWRRRTKGAWRVPGGFGRNSWERTLVRAGSDRWLDVHSPGCIRAFLSFS